MLAKLSNELVAQLGIKDAAEADAAIKSKINMTDAQAAELAALRKELNELKSSAKVDISHLATTESLNSIKASIVPKDEVVSLAKTEGSRAAAEALGSVGAAAAAKTAVKTEPDGKSGAQALIDQGKYEEAYAADPAIQAEHISAKSFAAYCKAEKSGRVHIKK